MSENENGEIKIKEYPLAPLIWRRRIEEERDEKEKEKEKKEEEIKEKEKEKEKEREKEKTDNEKRKLKYLFPSISRDEDKIEKLAVNEEALYSITPEKDANDMTNKIATYFFRSLKEANNKTIIDANSGVGGNTISFARTFRKVFAVDKNREMTNALEKNIKIILGGNKEQMKRIEVVQKDFDSFILYYLTGNKPENNGIKKKDTIIFFDPPWGGPDYVKIKEGELKLYLGEKDISSVINELKELGFLYFALKAPFNFDIEGFKEKIESRELKKYSYGKGGKVLLLLTRFD